MPACLLGGLLKELVDGGAVRLDIVDAPEVEAADFVGVEAFGESNGALEHLVLLLKADLVGAVHVFLGAVLRVRGAGPVDLVEGARDVGDLEAVFGENLLRVGQLGVGGGLEVLAVDVAQLDEVQADVMRDDGAGMIEVLRDFVRDDADLEG